MEYAVEFANTNGSQWFRKSFREGASAQVAFMRSVTARSIQVSSPPKKVDQRDHIDYWVWLDDKQYGVDVKGMKRFYRAGDRQDAYTCLELHGNSSMNKGWLFGGKADLIAFETTNSFVVVWRERLGIIANFFVSPERVKASQEALNKVYNRKGYEEITWVDTSMLRHPWLMHTELPKVQDSVDLQVVEHENFLVFTQNVETNNLNGSVYC